NPTGSTTFAVTPAPSRLDTCLSIDFTGGITKDWGGKPFIDLQRGWKYARDKYLRIDPNRAVAADASWGGYTINWIQGHPEYGFNLKALVCLDDAFESTYNGYSTEEFFFFKHDWGSRPWEVLGKSNAINYVDKWSTARLVIHGSKDYRLPETDGISAIHAFQQCAYLRVVAARLVTFLDEDHWVLDHEQR
ncbi:Alpha/Beta hydrolase protein, partial [Lactifluus subvellereus]